MVTRYGVFAGSVAGLILFTNVSVFGCKCDDPSEKTVEELLAGKDAVFSGTVIEIAPISLGTSEFPLVGNRVTFRVIDTWIGTNRDTKIVLTSGEPGLCGYPFVAGATYLVFGYNSPTGELSTHICSGTALLSKYNDPRGWLGEGQKPDRPQLNIAQHQGTTTLSWFTNWTNFRVEIAGSLQAPLLWQPVSNYVGVVGPYHVVTQSGLSSQSFFRLVR